MGKILKGLVVLFLASLLSGRLDAEEVAWRAPFVYYHSLKGVCTYESEPILTEGNIENITVNWVASGGVRMMVSANSGLNYTSIINGVPLDKGFVSGNQLRYKAILDANSQLHKVTLSYTDTSGARYTFGQPQLSDFRFRKAIDIIGPSETDLFNYQLKIKIGRSKLSRDYDLHCEAKAQETFDDIRFTAADKETPLAYYLESKDPLANSAVFWVKIPQLPKGENPLRIYIYYGNAQAQDKSSPEEVFDFFEDFNDTELNPGKWEVYSELNGEAVLKNSQLKLRDSSILSRQFKFKDGIIEFKAKADAFGGIKGIIRNKKEDFLSSSTGLAVYSSGVRGAEHSVAVDNVVRTNIDNPILPGIFYNFRATALGSELIFERYNEKFSIKEAELKFSDKKGLPEGYIGLKGESILANLGPVYFDWIRARQYAKTLPLIWAVGKEEEVSLPKFSGLKLTDRGELVLEDNFKPGNYESAMIPANFSVRIIIPDSTVPLNISTDAGRTYVKNMRNKQYHYASRGDFAAGDTLKLRIEFPPGGRTLDRVNIQYFPGIITVISPNGGENLPAGSLQKILWGAQEYEASYPLKLEYSLDKGKVYKTIVNETPNTGSFIWKVPEGLQYQEALIRISDPKAQGISDISDKPFSVILK